jgi:hypothetical protein
LGLGFRAGGYVEAQSLEVEVLVLHLGLGALGEFSFGTAFGLGSLFLEPLHFFLTLLECDSSHGLSLVWGYHRGSRGWRAASL